MADLSPYVYAAGGGIGAAGAFVGKWLIGLISTMLERSEARGDRLENRLFETQAVIYPALEAANAAIREAIAAAAKKEG